MTEVRHNAASTARFRMTSCRSPRFRGCRGRESRVLALGGRPAGTASYGAQMIDVPLEIEEDPDDSCLALTFVIVEVNGSPIRALLDSAARRSAFVHRPERVVAAAASDTGTGVFGVASPRSRSSASVRFAGEDLGMIEVEAVPAGHPGARGSHRTGRALAVPMRVSARGTATTPRREPPRRGHVHPPRRRPPHLP